MNLQNQQQSLQGGGAYGYTAGSGNDMSGSDYGKQVYGFNPWSGQANQAPAPQQAPSSYPTYQNQYGIGTGTGNSTASPSTFSPIDTPSFQTAGGVAQAAAKTSTPQANQQGNVPVNTTQGFNPWSLQGEANARIV